MIHILHSALLVCFLALPASGQERWLNTYGGSGNDYGTVSIPASDGGIMIAGYCASNDGEFAGMLHGQDDIFLMRLDAQGKCILKRTYGGSNIDRCNAIAATLDGGWILTGRTRSTDGDFQGMGVRIEDAFVLKVDSNGEIVWRKVYGGSRVERGTSIVATADGGYVLLGFSLSVDGDFTGLNRGSYDVFLFKLNANGDIVSKTIIGGSGTEVTAFTLFQTSNHDWFVAGYSESNDGDFIGLNQGGLDVFVAKLDSLYNIQWMKSFGGSAEDYTISCIPLAQGVVAISGVTKSNDGDFDGMNHGGQDMFVILLDQQGSLISRKTYGGSADDLVRSGAATTDGGLVIGGASESNDGDFTGMNRGSGDMVIMKLLPDATRQWLATYGGSGDESCESVIRLADGGFYILGGSASTDGDFVGLNKGGYDIAVLRLDSNGLRTSTTSISDPTTLIPSIDVSPNPVATSATISYTAEAPCHVLIELTDLMGGIVKVVYEGLAESGMNRVPLQASSLATGMYVVRMTTDSVIRSAQMCVVQ